MFKVFLGKPSWCWECFWKFLWGCKQCDEFTNSNMVMTIFQGTIFIAFYGSNFKGVQSYYPSVQRVYNQQCLACRIYEHPMRLSGYSSLQGWGFQSQLFSSFLWGTTCVIQYSNHLVIDWIFRSPVNRVSPWFFHIYIFSFSKLFHS